MTVTFNKAGKEYCGEVIAKGFFKVDAQESYEVSVADFPHIRLLIPVMDCQEV